MKVTDNTEGFGVGGAKQRTRESGPSFTRNQREEEGREEDEEEGKKKKDKKNINKYERRATEH